MAKFNQSNKWRRRACSLLSAVLAASLSAGVLAACRPVPQEEEEDNTSVSATDSQLLKNGDFEFFGEMDEDIKDRRALISTPNSWSFTAGSPSSDTASGLIDTSDAAWADLTRTGGYSFSSYTYSYDGSDYNGKEVSTFSSVADAIAHWEDDGVSAYDRLYFYDVYEDELDDLDSASEEKKFFDDWNYSVDYDDVRYLTEVCANGRDFTLNETHTANDELKDKNGVLMIHNRKTDNSVVGTAQYYTSSTTITVPAGAAAKVSLWARTDKLYHYLASEENDQLGVPVEKRAGAYIGVTNSVGGTSLDQMQIKNINTDGAWKQFTVYVRASAFANTTFHLVLGLGQGSSTDRYYAVNGYAFFDDVRCELISEEEFASEVLTENEPKAGVAYCKIDDLKKAKLFETGKGEAFESYTTYVLDLYASIDADETILSDPEIGLTEEAVSATKVYTSEKIDPSLGRAEADITEVMTLSEIKAKADHPYLSKIYNNDFGGYPFGGEDSKVLLLLSSNGAAYTAKLSSETFTLQENERILLSFFVKTSKIPSGYSGAGASLVELLDGAELNRTSISAFDSTTLDGVDIDPKDPEKCDIYDGWAQCFFFVENTTDHECSFRLELNYGPTTIIGTSKTSYVDGYAAFTNFTTKTLNKTEYSYASTGDRAVKISLTGQSRENAVFDNVSATDEKVIENGPALPSSFQSVLGGSNVVVPGSEIVNSTPENVYAGLLNSEHAETYFASSDPWRTVLGGDAADADAWWKERFGNARQPLVIATGEGASQAYGYYSADLSVSASSYREISLRVKVSPNAKAYVYLTDTDEETKANTPVRAELPAVTYWYDDFGDICKVDPASKDYNSRTDLLFEIQDNGLYKKVGDASGALYANLYNYGKDDDGNYVSKDDTIAYYYNKEDGKFYAYYDEEKGYSQVVLPLPLTDDQGNSITRYNYIGKTMPEAYTVVDGSKTGIADEWVTVTFYLAAGSDAKSYRLEVWSGSRDGSVKNPANSYVFFDNYLNNDASGDYSTLLDEAVTALKRRDGVSEKDNLSEELALYYTFTFYDSDSYLRYDATEDEEKLGNPHGSYTQSSYSEKLAYLNIADETGELLLTGGPAYVMFLDYTSTDVTVAEDDLSGDTNTDTENGESTPIDASQILLFVSSGLLAVVLLAVVVILITRFIMKKVGKKAKIKPAKDKRYKPAKQRKSEPAEQPAKAPAPAKEPDENDPYHD